MHDHSPDLEPNPGTPTHRDATGAVDVVQPAVVLVNPQMGENIGAAARAMLNFGFERMRLVAPRDGWPNPKAVAMASGAGRVLDAAQVYPDTAAAIADTTFVFATTARPRDLVKDVYTPETAMTKALDLIDAGQKVAILFGPERSGLENDDIAQADAIISVPVNPEFGSLNLAQCVLLVGYEYRRQLLARGAVGEVRTSTAMTGSGAAPATKDEIHHLAEHFERELDAVGYFYPEQKASMMRQSLRNLWAKLGLTRAEVQIFHGILRQFIRRK